MVPTALCSFFSLLLDSWIFPAMVGAPERVWQSSECLPKSPPGDADISADGIHSNGVEAVFFSYSLLFPYIRITSTFWCGHYSGIAVASCACRYARKEPCFRSDRHGRMLGPR